MAENPPVPTVIVTLTPEQFAQRMASLIPANWASQAAKQIDTNGTVYKLCNTAGSQLNFTEDGIAYALSSTRIQTAQGNELDLAAQDYFGDTLPRNPNESDDSYRARILAQLPPTGVTRPAISAAIQRLTGQVPRMIELWDVRDTGAWDAVSYWDVDTPANPWRWGGAGGAGAYQGYVITVGPTEVVLNGNPLETWDDSFYWDIPGFGWLSISGAPVSNLFELINRMKAEGTLIWIQIKGPVT